MYSHDSNYDTVLSLAAGIAQFAWRLRFVLDGPRIESQSVQDFPGPCHPAPCIKGTGPFFSGEMGVNRQRRGV
jgi:hypothetical protein